MYMEHWTKGCWLQYVSLSAVLTAILSREASVVLEICVDVNA